MVIKKVTYKRALLAVLTYSLIIGLFACSEYVTPAGPNTQRKSLKRAYRLVVTPNWYYIYDDHKLVGSFPYHSAPIVDSLIDKDNL